MAQNCTPESTTRLEFFAEIKWRYAEAQAALPEILNKEDYLEFIAQLAHTCDKSYQIAALNCPDYDSILEEIYHCHYPIDDDLYRWTLIRKLIIAQGTENDHGEKALGQMGQGKKKNRKSKEKGTARTSA